MNYFMKKRIQSGFTKSDMANELGIDYKKYDAIEKGSVNMPSSLIDKFNQIINKGKENQITKVENSIKADEFWKEVSTKTGKHTYVLHDKMKEFNIETMHELANLIGYKSPGTIFDSLNGRRKPGEEFKKRMYNFFSNDLNVQIPKAKEEKKSHRKVQKEVNVELDKYYEETDFKKLLKNYEITNLEIAKSIGVHNSTVSNMTCHKFKPSYKVIQGVKDYLDEAIKNKSVTINTAKNFKYSHSPELVHFFNTFNLMNWLREKNITPREFAKMSNVSEGSVYNFDSFKGSIRIPMDKTIKAIKDTVEKYEGENVEMSNKTTDEYISKQKLLNECEKEIAENNSKIEALQKQITELEEKNSTTEKFIALINALE